ncbi:hypothetical protein VKT23_012598 [Stygiomarasmius scandens]|uniref:Uncharacterized protein n=1 Tax=Marasmiellus scandens TaxID=2682957 RepID=A0ABR1J6A1_9AGAR
MSSPNSDHLSAAQRRTRSGGVFDAMLRSNIGFGPRALSNMDYQVHFKKVQSWGGNEKFLNRKNMEFQAEFIGELTDDANCHPAGNYSPGQKFEPITDENRVKWSWQLKCPGFADKRVTSTFHNQVAALFNVIEQPGSNRVKMWVSKSNPEGLPDIIHVTSEPIYSTKKQVTKDPVATLPKMKKIKESDVPDEADTTGTTSSESTLEDEPRKDKQIGDLYDPSVLPGYGGEWFAHSKSVKVVQLDIRDPRGELIPPYDTWMWMTGGALVYVKATLHVFNMPNRKIYQINAASIQVLDSADGLPLYPVIKEKPAKTLTGMDDWPLSVTELDADAEVVATGPINFESFIKAPVPASAKRIRDEPGTAQRTSINGDDDVTMDAPETSKSAGKKRARRP